MLLTVVMVFAAVPALGGVGHGQSPNGKPGQTYLTEEDLAFADAVNMSYAYETDEILAYQFGSVTDDQGRELWRPAGSDADARCADWLFEEFQRIGLQNVEKESYPVDGYTFKNASVQIVEPTRSDVMLGVGFGGLNGTIHSPDADPTGAIEREIVYVGLGRARDYDGLDVEGKLVAVDVDYDSMYWLNYPHYEAELQGAIGLVVHWVQEGKYPGSVYTADSECRNTIPAVGISDLDFAVLKGMIDQGPVKVRVWSDATVDYGAESYNVVGYIPGKTHPDEYIVFGAIYDKWWYGAFHHMSDVATMMTAAKALVDSGYEPDRTIVFIAIGAEEYGKADTIFAWAIGSHFFAHKQHSDWAGKTRAFIEVFGVQYDDTTLAITSTPESLAWGRQVYAPVINEYFQTNEPWSSFYQKAQIFKTWDKGLPATWDDTWNFGTSGMATMTINGASGPLGMQSYYADGMYHTQNDTMWLISPETLAMQSIGVGFLAIKLDRGPVVPYNFANWKALIENRMDDEELTAAGVNVDEIHDLIDQFAAVGDRVWKLIKDGNSANADIVNDLLMKTEKGLMSMIVVGGWGDQSFLPYQQYQRDTYAIEKTLEALATGIAKSATTWLAKVHGFQYSGMNVDYEVYKHFIIDGTSPGAPGLMWAEDRVVHYTDVWQEYFSIKGKEKHHSADFSAEIASLQEKYDTALANLNDSIQLLKDRLSSGTLQLTQAESLLSS